MASKRHIRRRSCMSKSRYATAEIAEWAAFKSERACRTGVEIGYYKCRLGDHWHLCRENRLLGILPRAAKLGAKRR